MSPARAQPADIWATPTGAIASWTFDPGPLSRIPDHLTQRNIVEAGIRTVLGSRIVEDAEVARVLSIILGASIVTSAPHRVCLLELEASHGGAGVEIERLACVLEIRSTHDHGALVRSLRSIMIEAPRAADPSRPLGVQREFSLPNGAMGVTYTEPGWPEWRRVSWISTPGAFVVGIGNETLERWFSNPAAGDDWLLHRKRADESRSERIRLIEAWVHVDRLRRGFPESFAEGRLGSVFAAWGLSNARSIMVHAWLDRSNRRRPRPIGLDLTWSARSRPPDQIERSEIAPASWPEDLSMSPPPGSFAIVLPADLKAIYSGALATRAAAAGSWGALEVEVKQKRWERRHGTRFERLIRSAEPWLVLADVPGETEGGFVSAFLPMKRSADQRRLHTDLGSVLAPFKSIAQDRLARIWTMPIVPEVYDPAARMRQLCWGFADSPTGPVLVVSWSPEAIEAERKRLQR